jgi:steroid 5-alpha reductase family enzyme
MLLLLLVSWVAAALAMALLWVWQQRIRNAALADAGWPAVVAGLACLDARFGDGDVYRKAAVVSMMGSWGLRLSIYLLYGRVLGRPEGGRFAAMRDGWRDDAPRRFFWYFQRRAASAAFFSLPALVATSNRSPDFSIVELVGAGLWIVAFAGESTADRQLLRFRSDPAHADQPCRQGLWRHLQRPDALFEAVTWVACALVALGSPWGWIAIACPVVMMYQLMAAEGV